MKSRKDFIAERKSKGFCMCKVCINDEMSQQRWAKNFMNPNRKPKHANKRTAMYMKLLEHVSERRLLLQK